MESLGFGRGISLKKKVMEFEFLYRTNDFFNDKDVFWFLTNQLEVIKSKVFFENGYWWTVEPLNYKCTSIKCCNPK